MFRHTKGPWVAWFGEPDADGFIQQAGIDTAGREAGIVEVKVLAENLLTENDVDEWNETLRGDTTLIAAAPELLAACRRAIQGVMDPEARKMAKAAVAKAEGSAA